MHYFIITGFFWGGGARGEICPPPLKVALPPLRWGMINSIIFPSHTPSILGSPDSPPEIFSEKSLNL